MSEKPAPSSTSLYRHLKKRIHAFFSRIGNKWHAAKKKHWYFRHLKAVIFTLVSLGLVGSGIFAIWISQLQLPDLSAFNAIQVPQSTKIYDSTGKILLYDISGDVKRTVVPLSSISPYIQNAAIAIEDTDFYTNIGIKPLSIIRSALVDAFTGSYDQG